MRQAPKGVILCAQGPSRSESTVHPYINLWKAAWASSMIFSGSTTRALYPQNAEHGEIVLRVDGAAGRSCRLVRMEPAAGPQIALIRVDFRVRHVRFKSNAYRRRNCDFPKVGTENGSKMAAGAPFLPYVPYDRPVGTGLPADQGIWSD